MIKRTLFIEQAFHISTKLEQLVLRNKKTEEEKTVPMEDIGYVVFENGESTFSLQAIAKLSANNTAVIFCNTNHLPSSMLLNLEGNDIQSQIFTRQINASEPLKKQLWQQTIKAKISNQALLLKKIGKENEFLKRCGEQVKSGDTTNEEAKASRFYWQHLFDDINYHHSSGEIIAKGTPNDELSEKSKNNTTIKRFTRSREGEPPNNLLNYGYTVLRAAIARALTGSGLLPTLGIHHHNKYNVFCLADDIMEPYRPWVDQLVYRIIQQNIDYSVLTKEHKIRLLEILQHDVRINDAISPLMIALSQTSASLAECFAGEKKAIKYPEIIL